MKKALIFGALLAISLIASDDCSRETTRILFAGGTNAAKFFEFNEKNHKCELNKKVSKLIDQLDVHAGLMQTFSEDVKQYLCEEPNTEGLKELILNQFRIQDPAYYKQHEDDLNTYNVENLTQIAS